ncbi:MAG: hypothetical protein LLF97_05340 [Planctomycetaceae bacterium]|nr:hypothetical protein [Planctomycetaceae bacterium]
MAVAVGLFVLLDVLLLVSFGWSELIDPQCRNGLWIGFAAVWLASVAWSGRQCVRRAALERIDGDQDPFGEAIDHYLRGDYFQTEQTLERLLRRNPRDLDARLMLAGVLRRTGRRMEAMEQLDMLSTMEGAGRWELEMQRERELLAKARTPKAVAA